MQCVAEPSPLKNTVVNGACVYTHTYIYVYTVYIYIYLSTYAYIYIRVSSICVHIVHTYVYTYPDALNVVFHSFCTSCPPPGPTRKMFIRQQQVCVRLGAPVVEGRHAVEQVAVAALGARRLFSVGYCDPAL